MENSIENKITFYSFIIISNIWAATASSTQHWVLSAFWLILAIVVRLYK